MPPQDGSHGVPGEGMGSHSSVGTKIGGFSSSEMDYLRHGTLGHPQRPLAATGTGRGANSRDHAPIAMEAKGGRPGKGPTTPASAGGAEGAVTSSIPLIASMTEGPPRQAGEEASIATREEVATDRRQRAPLYGSRALAAGSKRRGPSSSGDSGYHRHALSVFGAPRGGELGRYINPRGELSSQGRYLVVGDGLMAPFMALCLRVHGLECELAYHQADNDIDRGTIALVPSVTQLMGDILCVSVPSGSVIGRILTFDHVGNDMCDIDLNEFREKGESPTFFCCDRLKVEAALLSLCHRGPHSCHVLAKPQIERGGLEALEGGGVRVRFTSGVFQDYLGVICTSRNQSLVPELVISNEELQQRAANTEKYRENFSQAVRWLELCVPPLPEVGPYEKRFTPGSQEIVEILTPRDAKMIVRPTMMATKLFYNVSITIPDATPDPRLKSTSTTQFWKDVIMHWTASIPGYISHTMFRPLVTHMQQNFTKSSALVFRSPLFLMPHWSEGGGRVIKIAHAAHGACFDAVDVADAQGFADCFGLARTISTGEDITRFLADRRLQVMEEMDYHAMLVNYGIKERGQMAYTWSRFNMKFLRKYKKAWRSILHNYVTLMPKTVVSR